MSADAPGGQHFSDSERDELERLRREVDEMKGRPPGRGGAATGGRWFASVVLLLLSAIIGVVSVVGVYLRTDLLDTSGYVATVAPLARDPAVQSAITNRLTQ